MATDIDLHVGKRLRWRRRLLGLTQQELASQVGVRFQQIQKYECGANRVTSGRLYDLSRALNVKVQYFFDGLEALENDVTAANDSEALEGDILSRKKRWNSCVLITAWKSVHVAVSSNLQSLLSLPLQTLLD